MVAEWNIQSIVFPWYLPSQLQPMNVSVKMSFNYTCKHAWQVSHRRGTPNHNLTAKEWSNQLFQKCAKRWLI